MEQTMLPEGCGYQGYEFGASYPDSMCFGGRLYDCDDCDSSGNLYEPTEDVPCPICEPAKAIGYWSGRQRSKSAAWSLVNDIRRNRGVQPYRVGGIRKEAA